MFESLGLPWLLLLFAAAGTAVWVAGIYVSNTTDVLSSRLGLGEALGGVILLAVVTNLPEVAITVSAAWQGNLGIAVGNILGGIAVQTVVLVLLDRFGLGRADALTYRAASLVLVLEGVLVMAVLTVVVMGTQLPPMSVWRLSPTSVLIVVVWIAGVVLLGRAQRGLPWHEQGNAPHAQAEPSGQAPAKKDDTEKRQVHSLRRTGLVFLAGAVVTLVGGVVLERTGDGIAEHLGMTGVLFGATILAAATSLPEISTGLASIKLGDYKLAVSDIFGGNAFLPVLFLLASLISGKPVLPDAQRTDIYLTGLGMLLTAVYVYGLIFRPRRQVLGVGVDSLLVLVLYAVGIVGLIAIARDAM